MLRVLSLLAVALVGTAPTGCLPNWPCDREFQACGTLVQGVECVLFEADDGQQFVLDNEGSFQVGDRVRVGGTLDRLCITTCQEGDGCIGDNTIEACDTFEACGALIQGVECVLFEADSGQLFLLDDIGGFQVGDRVEVRGTVDPNCVTICQQGEQCIGVSMIAACPV
jgi:hypothetical protein